jgi:hypothetical protein
MAKLSPGGCHCYLGMLAKIKSWFLLKGRCELLQINLTHIKDVL